MSFPRYPKYKDSGVEWLGEVPDGWGVAPLKSVTTHNDDTLDEATPPDTEILYVDISGVDALEGIKSKEPMLFGAAPSRARRLVKHGDTIVSTVRTYLRAIARVRNPEDNLIVSTGFAVIRPRADLSPDYVGYALSAGYFIEQVIARSTGVSYPAINASELVRIPVALPPLPEQTAIAAFLDRETAKIDALVAEQERLIELLKEKRQAVISHAVTKGLDPRVRRKPSGVEWLGEVPEHWSILRLEHIAGFINGKAHEPFISDNGSHICVNARFVSTGGDSFKLTSENITPARQGDILMVMSDLPNGRALARAYLVRDTRSYAVNQRVCAIRTNDTGDSRYFAYQLNRNPALLAQDDGSNQTHLSNHDFTKLKLCVPSLEEQRSIADYLDSISNQFDVLIAESTRAIDLLRERRTALISAAVTGKIDVRGTE